DIDDDGFEVAKYSSLPHQIDTWFKAWHKVCEMCGTSSTQRRNFLDREIEYLDSYVRGVYAKKDLSIGQLLTEDDCWPSQVQISLQKFGYP
uniref:hypothetical protein n=1 Tax=Fulvivirga sp. TaxID=1931237 RepID=UPI00404B25A1